MIIYINDTHAAFTSNPIFISMTKHSSSELMLTPKLTIVNDIVDW